MVLGFFLFLLFVGRSVFVVGKVFFQIFLLVDLGGGHPSVSPNPILLMLNQFDGQELGTRKMRDLLFIYQFS